MSTLFSLRRALQSWLSGSVQCSCTQAAGAASDEEGTVDSAVKELGLEGLITELVEEAGQLRAVEEEVMQFADAALGQAERLKAENVELRKVAEDAALDKCAHMRVLPAIPVPMYLSVYGACRCGTGHTAGTENTNKVPLVCIVCGRVAC